MKRIRAVAALIGSAALLTGMAGPVAAEPLPPTLSIQTSVTHYLGGWWEQWVTFSVTCDGYWSDHQITVDLPGSSGDLLQDSVPAGTRCWLQISEWSSAGEDADWDSEIYTPGWEFLLNEGSNVVDVVMPRIWVGEWPPQDDTGSEHSMAIVVDRIYMNGKGGIEVEGTSWCDAADILKGASKGNLYANAQWTALQYLGRKTALAASYDSAIAHPCWLGDAPGHGPFRWETRYPYPDGSLQWVYASNGRFGSGTMHVEARSGTETWIVTQSFAPGGWTSFEGLYVPYASNGPDSNGDGWSVAHHYWFGWDQADLKPIRVK